MVNVSRSIFMLIAILIEVTVALMSWLEIENAMMSTIFQPVKIMMEVTVDHLTSLNGYNVPTILHSLEMEDVIDILNGNQNAIMMAEIAANNHILGMDIVLITTIFPPVVILMEAIVNLMGNVMNH